MRLLILCSLASVGLLLTTGARADGLGFDGDTPLFPHFFLELDSAQKQAIASEQRLGSKYVEMRLTPGQREVVKKEAGATVRWLFAVDRKALEGECSCGAYNLGVLIGGRLAVFKRRLGDHLSPGEVAAIEADLSGGAPPRTSPRSSTSSLEWKWSSPEQAERPEAGVLSRLLPAGRFDRVLRVPGNWRVVRLRLPALPRLGDETDQDCMATFGDPSRIGGAPREGTELTWPKEGARLDGADGGVTWLLPVVVPPGIGPPARAWAVFEYRRGRLAAVAVSTEYGRAGGLVVGPDP